VLADYLKELQQVGLLNASEERQLWERFRGEADGRSRTRLIEAYQPLVFKVVMQIRPPDALLMDMIQEGALGLIEAVERFDHERGIRFSTYATYRIRGCVLNALRRLRPREYSLDTERQGDTTLASTLPDPRTEAELLSVEDGALYTQVRGAIDRLPARQRAILTATYLHARQPRSVATELHISLSHFYRLHKDAVEGLRRLVWDDMHHVGGEPGY
jgi:RNA polymerase sporulation-specific sigma factor